jgi:hypothetical protein
MNKLLLNFVLLISFKNGLTQTLNCFDNPFFSTMCTTTSGTCPSFNNSGNCKWHRSHGSPTMISNYDGKTYFNFVYMWAVNNNGTVQGEGIFAPFTFLKNRSYSIIIEASATTSSTGNFLMYAVKGALMQPGTINCGDDIPSVAPQNKQLIMNGNPVPNGNYQVFSTSFTPDSDGYNQIWIYPTTNSTIQYNLSLHRVSVCLDCDADIIYNVGTVPVGTSKGGHIYAGSSAGTGGSGIVNVSPTSVTTLSGAKNVFLKSEFLASVTTGTFTMNIVPCNDLLNRPSVPQIKFAEDKPAVFSTDSISIKKQSDTSNNTSKESKIQIYPNPSDGLFEVEYSNSKQYGVTQIVIRNQLGLSVYNSGKAKLQNNKIVLSLRHLPMGIYYLQLYRYKELLGIRKFVIAR